MPPKHAPFEDVSSRNVRGLAVSFNPLPTKKLRQIQGIHKVLPSITILWQSSIGPFRVMAHGRLESACVNELFKSKRLFDQNIIYIYVCVIIHMQHMQVQSLRIIKKWKKKHGEKPSKIINMSASNSKPPAAAAGSKSLARCKASRNAAVAAGAGGKREKW